MTRDRQGWFGGMLGGGGEVEGEAKNDMRTLQARAVYELRYPRRFCSCCAAQLVLEKQLQDIIRYTNELENREATMCVRKERLCTLQVPDPHPPHPIPQLPAAARKQDAEGRDREPAAGRVNSFTSCLLGLRLACAHVRCLITASKNLRQLRRGKP
jgi:hypothetical protein